MVILFIVVVLCCEMVVFMEGRVLFNIDKFVDYFKVYCLLLLEDLVCYIVLVLLLNLIEYELFLEYKFFFYVVLLFLKYLLFFFVYFFFDFFRGY